jgi:hypothetical protein
MPRTCTTCGKTKDSDKFTVDKRNKSGLTHVCKACKNSDSTTRIECESCGKMIHKNAKSVHMRSARCKEGKTPWSAFKSNGKKIVYCTCMHERCSIRISEANVYKHLKYGFRTKLPAITCD